MDPPVDVYSARGLPPTAWRGIEEFNQGRYYECHETLEIVWRKETGDTRALLHGIIQFAVGLVHVERANFKGATALLNRSISKLAGLPADYQGVDVASLLNDARQAYVTVLSLGPVGMAKFPWDQAPVIKTAGQ
jgi:predicted metal-dependent hydrolase